MLLIIALALGVGANVVNTGGGNGNSGTTTLSTLNGTSSDNNTYKSSLPNTSSDSNISFDEAIISQAGNLLNTLARFYCQSSEINQSFNIYYQLGSVFFLLAFLAPHSPCGVLWMRITLITGCCFYTMWARCTPDALFWATLFLIVNFIYMVILLFKLRPVSFDKEFEAVSTLHFLYILGNFLWDFFVIFSITRLQTPKKFKFVWIFWFLCHKIL